MEKEKERKRKNVTHSQKKKEVASKRKMKALWDKRKSEEKEMKVFVSFWLRSVVVSGLTDCVGGLWACVCEAT